MKAIVAEVDKKHMIVITAAGDFVKIRAKANIGIGDEIEISPRSTYKLYRRAAALAACLMIAVMLTTGVYAYYTPYSYISVDINPSIGLSLNRFERVISAQPLSQDGAALLKSIEEIKNLEAADAVTAILHNAAAQGYMKEEEEPGVVIVVTAKDDKHKEKLKNDVSVAAKTELSKVSGSPDAIVAEASFEDYKKALEKQTSPGKAVLVEKIQKLNPEVKPEEVKDLSVKETMKLLKELRKQEQKKKMGERERKEEQEKDKGKGQSGGRTEGKNEDKEERRENKKQEQKDKETMKTVSPKPVDKSKTDDNRNAEQKKGNQKNQGENNSKEPGQKNDDEKSGKPEKEDRKDEIKDTGRNGATPGNGKADNKPEEEGTGSDKEKDKEGDSRGNNVQKQDKGKERDKEDKDSGGDKENDKK